MAILAKRDTQNRSRLLYCLSGFLIFIASFFIATSAQASTEANVVYTNDGFTAQVQVTSLIELEVSVKFENAVGVAAENFELDFQIVSPLNTNLLNRLPGTLVSLPADFPVLISIKPIADRGFSFEGVAEIEIYTKNLHYVAGSPLRLFHSSDGGEFKDITVTTGAGSYRARGQMGTFSDFLIAADLRTPVSVVAGKVTAFSDYLQAQSSVIESPTYNLLSAALSILQQQVSAGSYGSAQNTVNEIITILETADGAVMPSIWRSSKDLQNVSGTLLAQARTIRYSLRIL
ncbi:hypothetical protein A28LD_1439 [Idiomarina sp. A28L]|nr:hypothetical protein A28LD_1439 [Idiomarina sp. A28L]